MIASHVRLETSSLYRIHWHLYSTRKYLLAHGGQSILKRCLGQTKNDKSHPILVQHISSLLSIMPLAECSSKEQKVQRTQFNISNYLMNSTQEKDTKCKVSVSMQNSLPNKLLLIYKTRRPTKNLQFDIKKEMKRDTQHRLTSLLCVLKRYLTNTAHSVKSNDSIEQFMKQRQRRLPPNRQPMMTDYGNRLHMTQWINSMHVPHPTTQPQVLINSTTNLH